MSKVKFKDLRQGVTIYTVMGYDPLCASDDGVRWKLSVNKCFVTGKPRLHPEVNAWYVPVLRTNSLSGQWKEELAFLNTYNVRSPKTRSKWPCTNHACFLSLKAAMKYSKRFAAGTLTHAEQEHAIKWRDDREEMRREWIENDRFLYEAEVEAEVEAAQELEN